MLAFNHDSFMTSYKWPSPGTVDALDMDNGLHHDFHLPTADAKSGGASIRVIHTNQKDLQC